MSRTPNTAALLARLRELLASEPDLERVESIAQKEAREREAAAAPDSGMLPPWPRRKGPPDDVLWITFMDQSEYILKLSRISGPDPDEFRPPWKGP